MWDSLIQILCYWACLYCTTSTGEHGLVLYLIILPTCLHNCRVFLFSLTVRGKPTPLAPSLVAFFFTSVNGFMQGRYLTQYVHYEMSWFYDPRFLVGHILFLAGMAINVHSDAVLRSLRKPGETEYKIPYGIITPCIYF